MEWRCNLQPIARKLVTVVTEAVIEKELIGEIEKLGVSGYTITDARGKGHRGVRNAGWEHGANIRIELVCEEQLAQKLEIFLNEHFCRNYAMFLFVSDVHVLIPGKFSDEEQKK